MSIVYQVQDWDRLFENNKSRERDQCHFVCIPNKQDGMGLTRILAHPHGAAIYGIWHLILGACSRQCRPRAGWLTLDGHQTGTAWAPDDLALRWRRPLAEIEEALQVLSSPNVGWLNALQVECPPSARLVPVECPPTAREVPVQCLGREGKGTEENGTEGKKISIAVPDPPRVRFKPPSVEEVQLHAAKIGLPPNEAEKFWSFYGSKGWMVGKSPMKSWVQAMAGWKVRWQESGSSNHSPLSIAEKEMAALARSAERMFGDQHP